MKYIKIKNGVIDTIMLNEACSSGCGSFIETLTKSLDIAIPEFISQALKAKNPVDLGSRCTVFMNSKIKQTQKEGKPLGDIFAGLSYSVVKNAILKVMKIRNVDSLGENIIVQGGTFLNDAVLRAFEIITGKEVVRPNIAGLMGAYGIALVARDNFYQYDDQDIISNILSLEELENLQTTTTLARCKICENNCNLTISKFNDKKLIMGNRCERGAGGVNNNSNLPNMYKYKYDKLFNRPSLDITKATRGVIGIPRVLNMYENYPFWHTFFTELGFRVVLSDQSSRSLYESGIESMPSESVCYPAKLVHGHIMNLLQKGVKTIFYPCIMYENKEFEKAHNCFNCPIVISYSETIRLNVDELKNPDFKYINPFLPLKPKSLLKRIKEIEDFSEYEFSNQELKNAITKAFQSEQEFKKSLVRKGEEYLSYLNEHQIKGIVLSGRPYHIDPEINHGIDSLINNLGLAVLTEDAICYQSDFAGNLRIMDQWAYHSRLYRAADEVSKQANLELVQLTSFGCGLDAITTDQVEEILKFNNKIYTLIKIDEINNLGAIKIRIRSLIAAMNKRENLQKYIAYNYDKILFTKEMKKQHHILCPDLSPYHSELLTIAMKLSGYNMVHLTEANENVVEEGLKYVNNDACYPALIVIGQLIVALKSGKYDINNTSVLISQTGGGCRATNYIGLLRKALADAGYTNVPVISFNVSGLEKNPGFKITLGIAHKLIMSVVYSDLLMRLLLQTRPYEKNKGETEEVYHRNLEICKKSLAKNDILNYRKTIQNIINNFLAIKIIRQKKPKVGIVGEILIKYHAFGNNYLLTELEQENVEVILPDLMGFIKYTCYNAIEKEKYLKENKTSAFINKRILSLIEMYESPVRNNLKNTRFYQTTDIYQLAKNVDKVLSTGNQTGEGWYLTGEMIELIERGITNIVCVQPFACLPNHIVGKSVIKKIRELYPLANIVSIDYDPGASHSNQVNRIKLMLTVAREENEQK